MFREWNSFNLPFAMMLDHSFCHFFKRLSVARTTVEDARNAILHKPQVYLTHVTNVDEVTFELLATCEQFWIFTRKDLVVKVESNRCHAAFMLLTRAINIEVTEACDLR